MCLCPKILAIMILIYQQFSLNNLAVEIFFIDLLIIAGQVCQERFPNDMGENVGSVVSDR